MEVNFVAGFIDALFSFYFILFFHSGKILPHGIFLIVTYVILVEHGLCSLLSKVNNSRAFPKTEKGRERFTLFYSIKETKGSFFPLKKFRV